MRVRGSLLTILLLLSGRMALAAEYSCNDLRQHAISPTDIGLPTRGAKVYSADHVKGTAGGYCRVVGRIGSIDPAADPFGLRSIFRRRGTARHCNSAEVHSTDTSEKQMVGAIPSSPTKLSPLLSHGATPRLAVTPATISTIFCSLTSSISSMQTLD